MLLERRIDHETKKAGVALVSADDSTIEDPQHVRIRSSSAEIFQLREPQIGIRIACLLFENRRIELVLVCEVLEDDRFGYPCRVGELSCRGSAKTVFGEDAQARLDQLLPATLR
jgi:hypothetical protein